MPLRIQLCHWRQPTLIWELPVLVEMLRPLPKQQDLWKASFQTKHLCTELFETSGATKCIWLHHGSFMWMIWGYTSFMAAIISFLESLDTLESKRATPISSSDRYHRWSFLLVYHQKLLYMHRSITEVFPWEWSHLEEPPQRLAQLSKLSVKQQPKSWQYHECHVLHLRVVFLNWHEIATSLLCR